MHISHLIFQTIIEPILEFNFSTPLNAKETVKSVTNQLLTATKTVPNLNHF